MSLEKCFLQVIISSSRDGDSSYDDGDIVQAAGGSGSVG